MEKVYRIELVFKNGQVMEFGKFHTTLEQIRKSMGGSMKNHPVVNVYTRYGKTIVDSFQG